MTDSERRTAAYLHAYRLHEALQGEDHLAVAAELPALEAEAEAEGWAEVAFVAAAGTALYAIVRPSQDVSASDLVDALLHSAERLAAPAFVSLALALRALVAAGAGDAGQLLSDAGRAVALLEDDTLPPLDRCTSYVVAAAAYNTLSLWEIVDELYGRATELVPLCPAPVQEPALAVNRILIRFEWGTALHELGQADEGGFQLARALAAVAQIRDVELPDLWRLDVEACETALRLLLGQEPEPLLSRAAEQSALLRAAGDIEVLPLLDACRALSLLRAGREAEAAEVMSSLPQPTSASSGARSFPAWVRAQVTGGVAPPEVARAYGDYALLVARLRWESRGAVLVAARTFLSTERLRADHRRLSRDVFVDALTGLQNRRAFDGWLERPGADGAAALLLVDLDGFKKVNDTYGHAAGDEVLRRVGLILTEHVRPGDLALRLGGDEFAVVLDQDAPDASAVGRRAEELRNALQHAAWDEVGPGLSVGASIGAAVGSLRQGAAHLYELADDALYQAKSDITGVVLLEAVSGS